MKTQHPETSIHIDRGGRSQRVAVGAASAQSTVIATDSAVVTATVAVFVRQGSDPTAVNTGADIYLAAGVPYRVSLSAGNKLAVIRAGTDDGYLYITPGA